MKILKWAIGGLALLVVVAVTAVVIVLSTLDLERYRGLIEDEAYKATGRKLTLAGPIDLELSLNPTLVVEDATFANADWGSRPTMMTLRRLELQAELVPLLSRTVRVTKLVLVEPDILIETNRDGTGNWVLAPQAAAGRSGEAPDATPAPAEPGEPARDLAFGVDELVIENGQFTYRDGATGETTEVRVSRLEASAPDANTPISLDLSVDVDGRVLALKGTVGAIDALGASPYPIDLDVEAGGAALSLDGVIGDPMAFDALDLNVSVSGQQLADLGAFAGTELPAVGAYRATFHLKQTGEVYALDGLTATLGDSDLAGRAAVDLGGRRPKVTAELTAGTLDLGAFTAEQRAAQPGGAGGATGGESDGGRSGGQSSRYVFTDDPLPLDALNSVDADVKLAVGLLRLDDELQAEAVDLALALSGGRLRLNPLALTFYGGRIQTWADLDSAALGTPVALKIDGDGIDYGTLLEVFGDENSFAGTVDIDADLTARGASMRAIAASLSGPLVIQGENGTIDNRWLRAITGGVTDILGPLFGNQGTSRLHCVLYTTEASNGVVTVNGMAVDSEVFTLFGGGIIDLRDETLDLGFDSGTRATAVSSLVPPFTVTGTLKDPKIRPRVAEAVGGIARALSGVNSLEDALAVFTQPAASDGATAEGATGDSCARALDAAGQPAPAPVTDGVQGATDRLIEGANEAIRSGDTDALEDAAKDALEGLKGLFGR